MVIDSSVEECLAFGFLNACISMEGWYKSQISTSGSGLVIEIFYMVQPLVITPMIPFLKLVVHSYWEDSCRCDLQCHIVLLVIRWACSINSLYFDLVCVNSVGWCRWFMSFFTEKDNLTVLFCSKNFSQEDTEMNFLSWDLKLHSGWGMAVGFLSPW